jgi:hypothetical protein
MDDAGSEISDWEVLSAASGSGGGLADDDSEVVVVSGGGGDILHVHDHFALAPAGPDPGSPGEGPWMETGDPWQGVELLDGFDEIPTASFDLATAGVWSEQQVPAVGVDEAGEGPIPEATVAVARGVTWGADASQAEVVDGEIEQGSNAVIDHGELGSVLLPARHGLGENLDSDAATPTGASLQREASETESSTVHLDGAEIDAGVERSCLEDALASDGIRGEQEEQEQRGNGSATSCCDEAGGEAKDGDLPLAPGAEEGDKQVVVWWKLPFRLLPYCAWKVKPVWSFSIAAALLGLVVLGRRMYRRKSKARGLPQIKIAFDDKVSSLLLLHTSVAILELWISDFDRGLVHLKGISYMFS